MWQPLESMTSPRIKSNALSLDEYSEYRTLRELASSAPQTLHHDKMELLTHYMIRYEQFGHEL